MKTPRGLGGRFEAKYLEKNHFQKLVCPAAAPSRNKVTVKKPSNIRALRSSVVLLRLSDFGKLVFCREWILRKLFRNLLVAERRIPTTMAWMNGKY
jgi:hypothetical protein